MERNMVRTMGKLKDIWEGKERCKYCRNAEAKTRVAGKPACKLCASALRHAGETRR